MGLAYTKGELVDRFAIELRKHNYGACNLGKVLQLRAAILELDWSGLELLAAVDNALANSDIANLEWQIREGHKLTDQELGLRAKAIRNINERRVGAKNLIDKTMEKFVPAYGPELPASHVTFGIQGEAAGRVSNHPSFYPDEKRREEGDGR